MSETESKLIFQKKFNMFLNDRNITQKEVAAICGVSTSTVSTWALGLNMPRMDKIEKLANFSGLPKSYFIENTAPVDDTPRPLSDDDIKFALFGGDAEEITDEMFAEVKSFAEYVKQRKKGGENK